MKLNIILLILALTNNVLSQPIQPPDHYWQHPAPYSDAGRDGRYHDPNKIVRDFIPNDPWRTLDGLTNNVKTNGVEFCGMVTDITPNGIIVEGEFGELFTTRYEPEIYEGYADFFVANYPFQTVNDQVIKASEHTMAYRTGTYTYTTVNGASRTIKKLDYGIPCEGPKPTPEQIAEEQAKIELDAKNLRDKAFQVQSNAIVWLEPKATNGSPSAQCSLGEHYLNGVGCETNRLAAIYWLQKATAQGDFEASNKLARLKM